MPARDDWVLVSGDSRRSCASGMAKDDTLIALAFHEDVDAHRAMAARIFDSVPLADVTSEQRSAGEDGQLLRLRRTAWAP